MTRATTYSRNMLLHDTRLAGSPPHNLASNIYNVGEKDDISHIFEWIASYSDSLKTTNGGGLINLYIMCHGYYTLQGYYDTKAQMTRVGTYLGGQGLQLGTNLNVHNLNVLNVLNAKVGKIIVYACGSAGGVLGKVDKDEAKDFPFSSDHPYNPQYSSPSIIPILNLAYDFEFLQGISDTTGATVFGADQPQLYTYSFLSNIDFGNWEGNLYQFNPHGVHQRIYRAGTDYF